MTTYEKFLEIAKKENITVIETSHFSGTRVKGLYIDNHIAINKDIPTIAEKTCILAEELGHHYTATGNIIDQTSTINRKQEMYGRIFAYDSLIGLKGIVDACLHHCQNLAETAEYLGVAEDFLNEALAYYKSKYGLHVTIDNYAVIFEPTIAVLELI